MHVSLHACLRISVNISIRTADGGNRQNAVASQNDKMAGCFANQKTVSILSLQKTDEALYCCICPVWSQPLERYG